MSVPSYPNRDWLQMHMDSRLTDALDFLFNSTENVASKTGASISPVTTVPPSIAALTVAKTKDGAMQAVIQDSTPINWGIHYFLEHSTTPNFAQPHVIHLGPSRTWVGPDVSRSFPYWRAYSMYQGQTEGSNPIYHQGPIIAQSIIPSTGSGTSSGNGQQGGTGFGLVPKRVPVGRSVPQVPR